jgi:DNA-directed RNA polymerase beta subunit
MLGMQQLVGRVNKPKNRQGKSAKGRGHDPSAFGIFCFETPEGESCGLVQNVTVLVHVRIGYDPRLVEHMMRLVAGERLRPCGSLADFVSAGLGSLVCLNGDPIGLCSDTVQLAATFRDARRTGRLPFDVSMHRDTYGLWVSCDMGCPLVPYLYAPNLVKLPGLIEARGRDIWNDAAGFWRLAVENGLIEYLDKREERECCVLSDIKLAPAELQRAATNGGVSEYTHIVVFPGFFLGIAASFIPHSDRNQAPRNVFQCAMGKAAIGTYALNQRWRSDQGFYYELSYPQRALVSTVMSRVRDIDLAPQTQNFFVAIMEYGGENMEDAIIFNRAAVERGLGDRTVFRVYRAQERADGNNSERLENPLLGSLLMPEPGVEPCVHLKHSNYAKLDAMGLPSEGMFLVNGDAVMGKVSYTTEVDATGRLRTVRRDASLILNCAHSEAYVVDRVMLTSWDGVRAAKVVLRSRRQVVVGDKASSRHGQKGTCGRLMAAEDLPFVADGPNAGMVPDIIVNPDGQFSRMTLGMQFEIAQGLLASALGKTQDGTPFSGQSSEVLMDRLASLGIADKVAMVNGQTGELIGSRRNYVTGALEVPAIHLISFGPCAYQMLRHMVKDKIHARNDGPRSNITQQPTEGRANNGGLRFGEMERDALLASGSSELLKERLARASDFTRAPFCLKCGMQCDKRHKTILEMMQSGTRPFCRACNSYTGMTIDSVFGWIRTVQEIWALQIKIQHVLKDVCIDDPTSVEPDDSAEIWEADVKRARTVGEVEELDYLEM